MIKYNLRCEREHGFEAWFRDSATCDDQLAGGAIECPVCGSRTVEKALMAPAIAKGGPAADTPEAKQLMAMASRMQLMRELRRRVEESCDYVGEQFPEEARRIHYGEVDHRDIWGEASLDEAKELLEEGVSIFLVPDPPREDA
jgi:hypothetical protein